MQQAIHLTYIRGRHCSNDSGSPHVSYSSPALKLKYKDTFVAPLQPWEGHNSMSILLFKRTSFHRCYLTVRPNELPVRLLTHCSDCAAFIFGTSFAFYISWWRYLKPCIFPQSSQRCSCKVPPPPLIPPLASDAQPLGRIYVVFGEMLMHG